MGTANAAKPGPPRPTPVPAPTSVPDPVAFQVTSNVPDNFQVQISPATQLGDAELLSGPALIYALVRRNLPVNPQVQSACEILGMDPIYVANEGKLLAIVAKDAAEIVLAAMQAHPLGQQAAIIGQVTAQNIGLLVAKTGVGGTRVIPMQIGEQLPRIC